MDRKMGLELNNKIVGVAIGSYNRMGNQMGSQNMYIVEIRG